jgi:hypothetical protein
VLRLEFECTLDPRVSQHPSSPRPQAPHRIGTRRQVCLSFYGFAWNKDATFNSMSCQSGLSHLLTQDMNLPRAGVATWAKYVFLREEPGGPPLEDYLAPLTGHFKCCGTRKA